MFRLLLAIRIEVLFLSVSSRDCSHFYISVFNLLLLNGIKFLKFFVHSTSDCNRDTSCDSFDQGLIVDHSQIISTSETIYSMLKPNKNAENLFGDK